MVETGALADGPSGWQLEHGTLAQIQSSHEAAELLARQFHRLPEPALRLLSVGAVLGREFSFKLAARLAGQSYDEATGWLAQAGQRGILWRDVPRSCCTFAHDKLRESLLATLSDPERNRLHHAAARRLEEQDQEQVFDIAYHYGAAGEGERALPYALKAGHLARSRPAFELSQRYYEIAERAGSTADVPTRSRIAEALGDVLSLRGLYPEAESHFQQAHSLSSAETLAQARIKGKLAELARGRGQPKASAEYTVQALRQLGHCVSERSWVAGVALLWELLIHALHGLFPRLFVGRRKLREPETDLLPVRLYFSLFLSSILLGKPPSTWCGPSFAGSTPRSAIHPPPSWWMPLATTGFCSR